MAQRYGKLPSELYHKGDTLDIMVINTATAWEQYQADVAKAKAGKGPMPTPNIPEERLQEMMDKVRGKNGSKKSV